jgi:uncharacterized protein (DUF1015 family)
MRLLAFQGLRYAGGAGEPGKLAAPPYDQINEAARARFHAASPYQFVPLTRPVAPDGAPGAEYAAAAALHARWLAEGIVAREARPALYPYVIELAGGGRRPGVLGLVEYAPPSVIRPHEQTLDKPLADRTALLEAMRVDLEPALLLAEDDGRLEELLAADLAAGAAPQVDYLDADGNHHRLFVIDDPARIALYQQAVADRPAAIADGHHRYKVGQRFAAEHGAAPGTAAGAKLAVVSSIRSPNLTIDPIHRALQERIDPGRLAHLAAAVTPFTGADGAAFAAAVAAAPQPALGVWVAGGKPEIWQLAAPPAGVAPAPSGSPLVVDLFQRGVLPALGLTPEAATDGTLVYRSNPAELYTQVAAGDLGTGFWLPPMQPADFAAAVARGEMLPPKSTRFLPKAMSGLAWSDHASKVI